MEGYDFSRSAKHDRGQDNSKLPKKKKETHQKYLNPFPGEQPKSLEIEKLKMVSR